MPSHRRVLFEWQPDILKTRSPPPHRTLADLARREEPLDQHLQRLLALHLDRDRAANQLRAPPQHGNRVCVGPVGAQQRLFRRAAGVPQRNRLPWIQFDALVAERLRRLISQRQVHVVAANQQMVAHGLALQDQFPFFLGDFDQRKIRRPAADVTDQQHVVQFQRATPAVAQRIEPSIDGCLRFFQQQQAAWQAGSQGRFAGQIASRRVERCGHRQHDELVRQRHIGKRLLPRGDQMFQVAACGGHRRDLGDARRRVPRQDLAAAIDSCMTQPRLGRTHRPLGDFGRLAASQFADSKIAACGPRQIEHSLADLMLASQVQERRQRAQRLDRAGSHQLGNGQQLDGRLLDIQRRVSNHAVRRAQVDT